MTDEPMTAELAEAQEDALRRGQTASLQGSDRNRVLQGPEASLVSLSMSTDGCVNVRIQALSAAASLDHYRERGNAAFKASQYFDAVERYTRASSVRHGHPSSATARSRWCRCTRTRRSQRARAARGASSGCAAR